MKCFIRKKNIISLHSSYFGNNFGDILLLNLFYDWVKSISGEIVVNLPMAYKKGVKELPPTKHGLSYLLQSSCLIYCGGGYFGEQPKRKLKWSIRNFFRHIIVGILSVFLRIPIAIIGVEFGPLSISWFRKLVIWLAKHAKIIIVRNAESKLFLESHGVYNVMEGVDAVLTLEPSTKLSLCNKDILIHIPNIRFAPDQYEKMASLLIKALKMRHIQKVTFVEDSYNQYKTGYSTLFSLFKDAFLDYTIFTYQGVEKLVQRIAISDYIVTTKLHVGITGVSMNKNVLSIYNHPKTLRFHKQVANEANCLSINASEKDMEIAINHFLDNQYILPGHIRSKALFVKKSTIDFVSTILTDSKGV